MANDESVDPSNEIDNKIDGRSLADQLGMTEEELDQKLLEGLNSGPSIPVDDEFWKKLKSDALARHNLRILNFRQAQEPGANSQEPI